MLQSTKILAELTLSCLAKLTCELAEFITPTSRSLAKRFAIGIYLMLLLVPVSFGRDNLPDLGNTSSPILSPQEEFELGRSILNEVERSLILGKDEITNDYLANVGYRIVGTFAHSQNNFYFFTVEDPRINAFALPGGFIGINTGLILAAETESELAGVLAHEIAHVKQRHIARMYEHMGRVKLSTIAGMVASIILATQNPEAGTGAMAATLAGSQQAMINFTREHEREADAIGIQALAKAGYDPMGMPSFFHRMHQDTRFYGRWIPEYLLTHPLTQERLIVSKTRAQEFPYKQIPDTNQFHYVKARVHVSMAKTPQDATHYYKQAIEKGTYRHRLGALYGLALAYLQEAKYDLAEPAINELLETAPNEPLFLLVKADWYMGKKQVNEAIALLRTSLKTNPKHYSLTTKLAHWLINEKQTTEAIRLIKKLSHHRPKQPELYFMLSAAYSKAEKPVLAHLAQSHALKLYGDYRSALTQLELAKKSNSLTEREKKQVEAQIAEIKTKL